jgi:hypothetical protein
MENVLCEDPTLAGWLERHPDATEETKMKMFRGSISVEADRHIITGSKVLLKLGLQFSKDLFGSWKFCQYIKPENISTKPTAEEMGIAIAKSRNKGHKAMFGRSLPLAILKSVFFDSIKGEMTSIVGLIENAYSPNSKAANTNNINLNESFLSSYETTSNEKRGKVDQPVLQEEHLSGPPKKRPRLDELEVIERNSSNNEDTVEISQSNTVPENVSDTQEPNIATQNGQSSSYSSMRTVDDEVDSENWNLQEEAEDEIDSESNYSEQSENTEEDEVQDSPPQEIYERDPYFGNETVFSNSVPSGSGAGLISQSFDYPEIQSTVPESSDEVIGVNDILIEPSPQFGAQLMSLLTSPMV